MGEHFIHVDEDGTEHYFEQKTDSSGTIINGLFADLTQSDLELKTENGYIQIKNTKTHSVKYFDTLYGRIEKQTDKNGNQIIYEYVSKFKPSPTYENYYQIKNVIDGAGRAYAFTYDSADRLSAITSPLDSDNKRFKNMYEYDDNGDLFKIHYYANGEATPYAYTQYGYYGQKFIYAFYSEDQAKVEVTYDSNKVNSIQEFGYLTTAGQKVGITYNDNYSTEFRTSGSDDVYGNTDDLITTYAFNYLGQCITSYTTSKDKSTVYGSSSATYQNNNMVSVGNKITDSASIGMTSTNLLTDTGLENDFHVDGWTPVNTNNTICYVADQNNTEAFSSIYCGCIVANQAGSLVAAKKPTTRINAGKTYTFSAYVKKYSSCSDIIVLGVMNSGGTILSSKEFDSFNSSDIQSGWTRLEHTFSISPVTSPLYLYIGMKNASAGNIVYFDNIQLEEGSSASYYNAISNGDFGSGLSSWTDYSDGASVYNNVASPFDSNTLGLSGDLSGVRYARQIVNVNFLPEETFILSGWAKANSLHTYTPEQEAKGDPSDIKNISNKNGRRFIIAAKISYKTKDSNENLSSTEKEKWIDVPFNYQYTGWQYISKPLVLKPDDGETIGMITQISVYCMYSNNSGTAYFDNISLVQDLAQSYTYDSEGNVISTKALADKNSKFEYSNNNLTKMTTPTGSSFTYTYDESNPDAYKKNNLISATSAGKVKTDIAYNDVNNKGLPTRTTVSGTNTNSPKIYSDAVYTNGNYMTKLTDCRGESVIYDINAITGVLNSTTDPNSIKTQYSYDSRQRLTETKVLNSSNQELGNVACNYDSITGYLSTINSVAAKDSTTTRQNSYSFGYDYFGKRTTTSVGTRLLSQNNYRSNNGKLTSVAYGNGVTLYYTYDELDRIKNLMYDNGVSTKFDYFYNTNGSLSKISGMTLSNFYNYDSIGRVISYTSNRGATDVFNAQYGYDDNSRINSISYKYNNVNVQRYGIQYDKDNIITKFTLPTNAYVSNTYDSLMRLSGKTIKNSSGGTINSYVYQYLAGNSTATDSPNATTTMVSSISDGTNTIIYDYDTVGNIKNEYKNGVKVKGYTYDYKNQITKYVNFEDKIFYRYQYDLSGNILKFIKYTYVEIGVSEDFVGQTLVEEKIYTYGDANWGDLLTNYNGTAITYDSIGNPLSYRNGIKLTWQNGRQLFTYTGADRKGVSYTYNENGVRIVKRYGATNKVYFEVDGTKIIYQKSSADGSVISFMYDENSNPIGLNYAGTDYYYTKNLQGDITGIKTSTGTTVVTYAYDPWGNITAMNAVNSSYTALMNANPFRYRSYYYDTESGFYYLQSRYYDPITGRFLNADGLIDTSAGVNGYNLFMYCYNNPVMNVDPDGMCPHNGLIAETYNPNCDFCNGFTINMPLDFNNLYSVTFSPSSTPSKSSSESLSSMEKIKMNPVGGTSKGLTYDGHGNARDFNSSHGAPLGTQIVAAMAGKVVEVIDIYDNSYNTYPNGGLANCVRIQVWDGAILSYGHMQKGILVKEGEYVEAGTPLGYVGNTGNSTGSHLHFGVKSGGSVFDYFYWE